MTDTANQKRRPGRPRRGSPPSFPVADVDRLLVHGEVVVGTEDESTAIRYPSYREIADRYGVAHSLISQYSKRHDCMRRREQARARAVAQADQKLIEMRANALAVSREDALRIIDSYILGFEKSLAVGNVACNNPGDFNTILRLRSFIEGGVDSRSEVQTNISLEGLQARHHAMVKSAREATPEERGELEAIAGSSCPDDDEGNQGVEVIPGVASSYCPDGEDESPQ